MSEIFHKSIYFPTLLLILHALVLLMTKHIHVCLSVTTSWNWNVWASWSRTFLLNTKLQVCLMYIQILMSNQTARTMATSHLDTNVTVNLIVETKNLSIFHWSLLLLPYPFSSGMSEIFQKLIYFPTLLLILYAFVFLITKHIHVCLSATTSWNGNLWASNWTEMFFLVFQNVELFIEKQWSKCNVFCSIQ